MTTKREKRKLARKKERLAEQGKELKLPVYVKKTDRPTRVDSKYYVPKRAFRTEGTTIAEVLFDTNLPEPAKLLFLRVSYLFDKRKVRTIRREEVWKVMHVSTSRGYKLIKTLCDWGYMMSENKGWQKAATFYYVATLHKKLSGAAANNKKESLRTTIALRKKVLEENNLEVKGSN